MSGISIHAAREGGDTIKSDESVTITFQSTPPVKAATKRAKILHMTQTISIHAAREGGDNSMSITQRFRKISIHAAREGGDATTLSLNANSNISIHAAREGGDHARRIKRKNNRYFNPRRP